jgi:hypothetical protein
MYLSHSPNSSNTHIGGSSAVAISEEAGIDEQAAGLKEIRLSPHSTRPVPFHFSMQKTAHSFAFAVQEDAFEISTKDSGELVLDQTKEESLVCALLRSAEGLPDESSGACFWDGKKTLQSTPLENSEICAGLHQCHL